MSWPGPCGWLAAALAATVVALLRSSSAHVRVRAIANGAAGTREVVRPTFAVTGPVAGWLRGPVRRWSRRGPSPADSVRELVEAWSRQLRAGSATEKALRDAIDDAGPAHAFVPHADAALAVGGDVGLALRTDASHLADDAARRALTAVSACWVVAHEHGGRLADALDRVADALRAEQRHVAHVRAELAGARASARLLAALPLFALFLASGLGMNPIQVLCAEPAGRAALVLGVALDAVGLWWTGRIARTAERQA